jgi:hypothetical protein
MNQKASTPQRVTTPSHIKIKAKQAGKSPKMLRLSPHMDSLFPLSINIIRQNLHIPFLNSRTQYFMFRAQACIDFRSTH